MTDSSEAQNRIASVGLIPITAATWPVHCNQCRSMFVATDPNRKKTGTRITGVLDQLPLRVDRPEERRSRSPDVLPKAQDSNPTQPAFICDERRAELEAGGGIAFAQVPSTSQNRFLSEGKLRPYWKLIAPPWLFIYDATRPQYRPGAPCL